MVVQWLVQVCINISANLFVCTYLDAFVLQYLAIPIVGSRSLRSHLFFNNF